MAKELSGNGVFLKTDRDPRPKEVTGAVCGHFGFIRYHEGAEHAPRNSAIVSGLVKYITDLKDRMERELDRDTKKELKAELRTLYIAIMNPRKCTQVVLLFDFACP